MTLRDALLWVARTSADPALDWDIPGDDMELIVLHGHRGTVGFACANIPDCNITTHEDWLERIFYPMTQAIPTLNEKRTVQ